MTPFQILLITFTVALFFTAFSKALVKEGNEKASQFFQVIAGFAVFFIPFAIVWCIIHYINW